MGAPYPRGPRAARFLDALRGISDRTENGTPNSAKDLAVQLVSSFGDPEAIVALLAEDVEWWITPTVEVFPHHMVGRDMVTETMRVRVRRHATRDEPARGRHAVITS